MNDKDSSNEEKKYWLDQPRNILIIIISLIFTCLILFFADAFYHKHTYFEVENFFGFYGVYGFFVCVALVVIAKSLRTILMRPEDYYDPPEEARYDHRSSHHVHD